MRKMYLISLCLILLVYCGGQTDVSEDVPSDSVPLISRVDPSSGVGGSQVLIYGLGFSYEAPVNIVTIGEASVSADEYNLLDAPSDNEIESITFTVPQGLEAGDYSVSVTVNDNTSNSDAVFSVTP